MDREKALIEQYGRLIDVGLHYDQKLWLVPGAGYAVVGILLNAIVSMSDDQNFAKAFQLGNQYALGQVKKELGMVETNEFAGIQPANPKDRWFIRSSRTWSAANTLFYIMLLTVMAQVGMAVYYLCVWL